MFINESIRVEAVSEVTFIPTSKHYAVFSGKLVKEKGHPEVNVKFFGKKAVQVAKTVRRGTLLHVMESELTFPHKGNKCLLVPKRYRIIKR